MNMVIAVIVNLLVLSRYAHASEILIGSYNVKQFGQSYMTKDEKATNLAKLITRYDVLALQEVKDKKESAIFKLMYKVIETHDLCSYRVVLGGRVGPGSQVEQYAIIYNSEKIQIVNANDYPDDDDKFSRTPLVATIRWKATEMLFSMMVFHAVPDRKGERTINEINALADASSVLRSKSKPEYQNMIILGDLNADCHYVKENKLDNLIMWSDSANYHRIITDDQDTTTSNTDCAYDRIFLVGESFYNTNYVKSSGKVYKFDDFEDPESVAKLLSDHYPVEFKLQARIHKW